MAIRRVAVIFDSVQRPETTGVYCLARSSRLVEVEHFQPGELDRMPRDGLRPLSQYRRRPAVSSAAGAASLRLVGHRHAPGLRLVPARRRAASTWSSPPSATGPSSFAAAGIASAAWLPLACDPEIHRKHDVAKQYDVAFVGNVFPGPRAELLNLIRRQVSRLVHRPVLLRGDGPDLFGGADRSSTGASRTTSTCGSSRPLACGSLLVTNDLSDNGQAELFRDGVHLATYREAEDLLDKLAFYLGRESLREQIAAAGRAEAIGEAHVSATGWSGCLREAERATVEGRRCTASSVDANRSSARGSTSSRRTARPRTIPFYFGHARPEVLALVPETARSGPRHRLRRGPAGRGAQGPPAGRGRRHRARRGGRGSGAAAASTRSSSATSSGSTCRSRPAGSMRSSAATSSSTCATPIGCSARRRAWLTPDGRLVASIPNVRHHSVVRSLLEGNWTYESAGLLDRTHLRFFTRREIEKLFFRAGFAIDEMRSVDRPGRSRRDRATCAGDGPGGPAVASAGLSDREAAEFYTYQYLVRARPAPVPDFGLTSIVIVTHNQLEYTRQCLDSLQRLTDEPYELIVVDNGSTDGTVEYLRALAGRAADRQRRESRLSGRGQPGDRGVDRKPGPAAE